MKRNYFQAFRNFSSTRLSGERFVTSGVRVETQAENIMFIGDSIVREAHSSYLRITGKKATFYAAHYLPHRATLTRQLILDLARKSRHDAIFVGGLGLHHLVKGNDGCTRGESPISQHRLVVKDHLVVYKNISELLGVPIVFFGSMTVDAKTILLTPQKHDWRSYFDWSVMNIWDGVESDLFATEKLGPTVLHFRPAELAAECPGVRCDGIHFASDFGSTYGCFTSEALWDHYLAMFLSKSLSAA
mmetsp:Transcript_19875/g.45051  ORF Transcript_19875/g.45051 Transcript_19875/m.45051 type:complete len:245 (+) Transcript_19875:2-736(+)